MFFKLVIVDRNEWMYRDMALQTKTILENNGNTSDIVQYEQYSDTKTIFFGTAYAGVFIPNNSIVTNFDDYRILFSILTENILLTCEIWDYSHTNLSLLKQKFPLCNCKLFEMGYTPYLDYENGYQEKDKDIDILFLGVVSHRRSVILNSLKEKYNVVSDYFKEGKARAELIKRSKICISIYSSDVRICISASRLTPILCNNGFVVTETCEDEYQNNRWKQWTITVDYDKLVETVLYYLEHSEERKIYADTAYENFKKNPPCIKEI